MIKGLKKIPRRLSSVAGLAEWLKNMRRAPQLYMQKCLWRPYLNEMSSSRRSKVTNTFQCRLTRQRITRGLNHKRNSRSSKRSNILRQDQGNLMDKDWERDRSQDGRSCTIINRVVRSLQKNRSRKHHRIQCFWKRKRLKLWWWNKILQIDL